MDKSSGKKSHKNRQSSAHKGKYAKYQSRSTCTQCRMIFKSPKYRLAHIASDHKSLVGQAKDRAPKEYVSSIFGK